MNILISTLRLVNMLRPRVPLVVPVPLHFIVNLICEEEFVLQLLFWVKLSPKKSSFKVCSNPISWHLFWVFRYYPARIPERGIAERALPGKQIEITAPKPPPQQQQSGRTSGADVHLVNFPLCLDKAAIINMSSAYGEVSDVHMVLLENIVFLPWKTFLRQRTIMDDLFDWRLCASRP